MAYLKMQPYRHSSLGLHKSIKLRLKYYGPFKVLQRIGQVAYMLLLPADCTIHPVFYISQLKKHIGPKVIPQANLPLTDSDGNIKISPEKLLNRRMVPWNNESVVQWLIQWVNLPESHLEGKGLTGEVLSAAKYSAASKNRGDGAKL
jgi:hypothetical protein